MKTQFLCSMLLLSACISAPHTNIAPENITNLRNETIVNIDNQTPEANTPAPVALQVTEIRTAEQQLILAEGEQKLLVAELVLSDGSVSTQGIEWLSSNTRRVVVSGTGRIERLAAGEVTIIATSRQDPRFSLNIQVLDAPSAEISAYPANILPSVMPEPLPEPLPTPGPLPEPSDLPADVSSPSPSASSSASSPTPMTTPTLSPTPTPTPMPTPTPIPSIAYSIAALNMDFVDIAAGSFLMGTPNRNLNERPQHTVTLSAFQIQTTEVTQKQWWDVMGSWPSTVDSPVNGRGQGDNYPLYSVSWCDIVGKQADNDCPNEDSFLKRLNQLYPGTYRLPTEAEWEYAARAGSTTDYACGSWRAFSSPDLCPWRMGWYSENNTHQSVGGSKPVGGKLPNAWGLYDMHGNLWEFVIDWYGDYTSEAKTNPTGPETGNGARIIRGGSYADAADHARSVRRGGVSPLTRSELFGFRLVRQAL